MQSNKKRKYLSKAEALKKAQHYCAYQERCHQEVKNKLYDWGLYANEVNDIIAQLINDDFLNEERFAKAFAGGKFRMKKWGRLKIIRELEARKISGYCIQKGLKEIEEADYRNTLKKLLTKKADANTLKKDFEKKGKIAQYAISKGYEAELVWKLLNSEKEFI